MTPGPWKPDREIPVAEQLARQQLTEHVNAGLKIIIGSMNPLKVGDILPNVGSGYIQDGRFIHTQIYQPFRIKAVTTFEDWIANTPPWIPGRKPTAAEARGYRFFEIFTD